MNTYIIFSIANELKGTYIVPYLWWCLGFRPVQTAKVEAPPTRYSRYGIVTRGVNTHKHSHTESYPHLHPLNLYSIALLHRNSCNFCSASLPAPLKSRDLVPQTLNVFRTYGALWEVFHRTMATERTHAETYSGCPHVLCSSGFLALRPRKHQKLKPGEFCARPFNFHILNWSPAFNCVCSLSPIATLKSADFVLLRFWRKLRTLRR